MGIIQLTLPEAPATVFLDSGKKLILFIKHGEKNFIDYQDKLEDVAWVKDSLFIGDVEYKYRTWHNLEEHERLKVYFREVLREVLQDI